MPPWARLMLDYENFLRRWIVYSRLPRHTIFAGAGDL